LSDKREKEVGTDPLNPDTDSDGILDGFELSSGTNPLDPTSFPTLNTAKRLSRVSSARQTLEDIDGDGLSNTFEEERGLDPNAIDSDGDGIPDGIELLHDLNPLEPNLPSEVQPDGDSDGLSDSVENKYGTNPAEADGDRDQLSDAYELMLGQDPTRPDTDDDGLLDGYEIKYDAALFRSKKLVIDFE